MRNVPAVLGVLLLCVQWSQAQTKSIDSLSISSSTSDTAGRTMDEVIVTAGGIPAQKRAIGTVSSVIDAQTLTAGQGITIAAGLQGKVAGLDINATSSGVNPNYRLILRGQRSLTGNNQALTVLDNVIVPSAVLGTLNPDDVGEIVILHGAGAAALYGSQASNGAIVITTKRGRKGRAQVQFHHTITVEEVAYYPRIQKKFGAGGNVYGIDPDGHPMFSYLENQSYGPAFDGLRRPLGAVLQDGSQDSAIYSYLPGHFTFWDKGVTDISGLSVSGGDEMSTFYLSGQYAVVKGTTPGDRYNRATLHASGARRVGTRIKGVYSISYTHNRYDVTSQTAEVYSDMLNMPSNVDIIRYRNWRTDKFANPDGYYNPWYLNPYFTADTYRAKQRNDYLTANLEMHYSPMAGLDLIGRQGIATRNYVVKSTVAGFVYTEFAKKAVDGAKSDIPASVMDGSSNTTELLSDLLIQYTGKWRDYSLGIIAGGQWRQDEAEYFTAGASGLVIPDLFNVSTGVGTPTLSQASYRARQMGFYGDLRVGYRKYLYLHVTGRNDRVSTLAASNRSFFYPSVDVSLIASDAFKGFNPGHIIDYLKIRAAWSRVGQVNLGNSNDFGAYYLVPTYSANANGFPYGALPGYTVDNVLISPNLRPEVTTQVETGIDLGMWKDRLIASATWYSSKTDNQTVTTSISSSTGFSNLRTNTGQTRCRGLELTAHVTPIQTAHWRLSLGGNYSLMDNRVNSISQSLPVLGLSAYASGAGSYAVTGKSFPVIMGFDYLRDPQGHVIVDAITGLPTISDTISLLGSASPRHRLGLDATLGWKRFRFTLLFEYRGGYSILNSIGSDLDWSGMGYRTAIYNRQPFVFPNSVYEDPNRPGSYVRNHSVTIRNGNGNTGFWTDNINRAVTSNYVSSGDFWKLREISIAYELPLPGGAKGKTIKRATISVQGRNLFIWLAKDNYYTDPEYSDAGNDNNGIGLNGEGQTPPSRYYGATLSISF